jgi:hypothetical protein
MSLFENILKSANIPTTKEELKESWNQVATDNNSPYNNNSEYSPFWRVVSELVTTPVLWILKLIIDVVMPNFYLKTATLDWVVDFKGWELELNRKPAARAKGYVTFSRAERDYQLTIPSGTRIETALINGNKYVLLTVNDVIMPVGEARVSVDVEAEHEGAAYNLAEGYYKILVEPIVGVTVSNPNDWITRPGADKETNQEYALRIRNEIGAKGNWNSDASYRSIISSFPGIGAEDVFFEHGAPRGPGTANAHILFDVNAPANQYLQDIHDYIYEQGYHGHGDDLQLFSMAEQAVDITLDIFLFPNLTDARRSELESQIPLFIGAAFRQNKAFEVTLTLPNNRFSFSRLTEELHQQFPEIKSLDFENDDILTGFWVPVPDNMDITYYG